MMNDVNGGARRLVHGTKQVALHAEFWLKDVEVRDRAADLEVDG